MARGQAKAGRSTLRCFQAPGTLIAMTETMTMTRPPEGKTLVLNAAYNIGVALANLEVGAQTAQGVVTIRRVARGHKFATRPIAAGEAVMKFGQIIGFAKDGIAPGDWVHEH